MHRRRSLAPAVLTRAEIPTSSMSAAASSALAGPAGAGGKTWQTWARSTYQPSSISFMPAIRPSSMAAMIVDSLRPVVFGQWLHEIKHDGFRIIARKDGDRVRLYSRPGNDMTRRFPLIVEALARLRSRSCIIDGEAVACDDNGIASFDLIRHQAAIDPVGAGLVASLARPGGNATGLSLQSLDLAGKRLSLLREVVPGLRRVAFMGNIDVPFVLLEMREVQAAARTLGLEAETFEIRRAQDIGPAFDALQRRVEGLYLASEALQDANRLRINILALGARLAGAAIAATAKVRAATSIGCSNASA